MSDKTPTRPRILFLSEMCLLDRNSGAAIEMSDWLKMLARHGYEAYSASMSLFDGPEEYPFKEDLPPNLDPAQHVGKRIRLRRDGIEHNVFNTGSSLGRNVTADQQAQFLSAAAEDIRRIRPDIVIGYGSPNLVPLRALARSQGAKCVFYLANDAYDDSRRACFDQIDAIVTPSQALATRYHERLGLQASVIGNFIPDFAQVPRPAQKHVEERRRSGFVTLVNPSLVKGGLFFLQIAAVMERVAPQITFLTLEHRASREQIENLVTNSSKLTNIWWLPRQADMHRIYDRTALLLMPSLWFEAAGRVVPEAQSHGVPVLAHRRGALEDQVGQGGHLLDMPARFEGRIGDLPTRAEIMPWVKEIRHMLGSSTRYAELSRRALLSADRYRPERRAQEIRDWFAGLMAQDNRASA